MDRALLGEEHLLAFFVFSTIDVQVSAWGGQLSMPLIARGSGQICNFLHTTCLSLSLSLKLKFARNYKIWVRWYRQFRRHKGKDRNRETLKHHPRKCLDVRPLNTW